MKRILQYMYQIRYMLFLSLILMIIQPTGYRAAEPDFRITMLDVGQGLAVLCESDGEYLLYDGGGRDSSSYVSAYLKQQGVDHLRYIIVSHYDEDHLAGLIGAVHTTEAAQVLSPDYETDTDIYASFRTAVEDKGIDEIHPVQGQIFSFGSGSLQILGPSAYNAEIENNRSLVIRISVNDYHVVLSGDAEWEEEQQILETGMNLQCDLYVVGHHGSASSSSEKFLDALNPNAAFISVGTDNSYGHPAEKTLNSLTERGIQVFRTDLHGEVTCSVSDEEVSFVFGKKPAAKTEETWSAQTDDQENFRSYVLNTNTKKFHYLDCSSVGQMKEKNRQDFTGTREEIIAMGFSPCGNCKP